MAYSKQTWTDDVSAVTGARMTHIEQGIYDNSLATDKINPSGTATTTAEIEEGQITDVIGFKSLKLKGQTSQDTTQGNNLLIPFATTSQSSNGITRTTNSDGSITLSGTATANSYLRITENITLESNTAYTTLNQNANLPNGVTIYYNDVSNIGVAYNDTSLIPNARVKSYTTGTVTGAITIAILVQSGTSFSTPVTLYPMLLKGTITTSNIPSYEKYSGGKASPNPDFPQDVNNVSGNNVVRISNKNLYDKDDSNLIMNNVYINATGFVLTSSNDMKTICMPCRANTTYTVSKTLSSRFIIGTASSNTIGTSMTTGRNNFTGTQLTLTTGANDKYLFVFYYNSSADTKTEQEIRNSIQVEIGSTATTYTTHQGNNFDIDLPVENLLNLTDGTYTNNGVTAIVNNNEILLNGTATTSTSFIEIPYDKTLPTNTTYTMSINNDFTNSDSGNGIRLASNDSTKVTFQTLNNNKTFSFVNALAYDKLVIRNVVGTSFKNAKVKIMLNLGSIAHRFTPYGTNPIELCEIGTYADYIYKKDGKWWKHKAIEKKVLNGTETWTYSSGNVVFYTDVIKTLARIGTGFYCDRFSWVSNATSFADMLDGQAKYQDNTTSNRLIFKDLAYTDVNDFKTWLSTNTPSLYYVLATPIEEEITYEPLLRQLDELYNSGLYDVTNISQDNSSEAFILDLEACKNNINGIVEYIRR